MAESGQGNITIGFLDPKNHRISLHSISIPPFTGPKAVEEEERCNVQAMTSYHLLIYLQISSWILHGIG